MHQRDVNRFTCALLELLEVVRQPHVAAGCRLLGAPSVELAMTQTERDGMCTQLVFSPIDDAARRAHVDRLQATADTDGV